MLYVTAYATTETITFSDLNLVDATLLDTCDIGGENFTLTFSKANGSNSPAYYTSDATARIYANTTMTVSSDYNITSIVLTCASSYAPSATSATFTSGTYDADSYTWTGETTSVTMTNDSSRQIRLTAISVTYDDSEAESSGYDWHWTFDSWTTGSFTEVTTVDGLTYMWSSGRGGEIGEAEVEYNGNTYTKYCQLGSSAKLNSDGTPKYSALSFNVTGPCEVYVVAGPRSNASSAYNAYIALAGDTLATTSVSASEVTSFTATYDGTADTTIYVYAYNKVNIYEIDVTYTDDNNDGDGNTGSDGSSSDDNEEQTETLTATYTLTPTSVSGAWLTTDDATSNTQTENIDTVTIVFDEKVYINPNGTISGTSDLQASTVTVNQTDSVTIQIIVSGTDGTAWQYVILDKGAIGDSTANANNFTVGNMNAYTLLYYYWEEPSTDPEETLDIVAVTPENNDTVETLSSFIYEVEGDNLYDFFIYTLDVGDDKWADYIAVTDSLGATLKISSVSIDEDTGSQFTVALDTIISTENIIYVEFKAGFLGNTTWYANNYSKGEVNKDTTFVYYVVPAPIPDLTYDLTIDTIIPSSDSYVEELSTITLYFGEPVYINPNGSDDDTWSTTIALFDYSTREEVAEGTLSQTNVGDSTIIVTLDSIFTEFNTYRLYLPQGVIGDTTAYEYDFVGGRLNARMSSAVVITVGAYSEGTVSITPADNSTVTELTAFTVTYEEQGAITQTFSYYPYLSDSNGTVLFTWTLTEDDASINENSVTLTLSDTIKTAGTYTLTIPAVTFSLVSADGNTSGYNEDFTATYIIEETTGISNVSGTTDGSYRGISADADGNFNVYTISGMRMMTTKSGADINNLPAGLYIINGAKIAVK